VVSGVSVRRGRAAARRVAADTCAQAAEHKCITRLGSSQEFEDLAREVLVVLEEECVSGVAVEHDLAVG
jgi:hypothetical protein